MVKCSPGLGPSKYGFSIYSFTVILLSWMMVCKSFSGHLNSTMAVSNAVCHKISSFTFIDIDLAKNTKYSCLTAVKKHVIKYCEKVYERSGKNLFWSIKNSGEILDKLKAGDFNATSLSTYDFSTLYTTLPHNLIKDKLIDLIESTFQREGSPYLACNDRNAFFTSEKPKKYHAWSCQNVCDALTFLLDNIFIRFGTKLHRQVVGIPMGTNCAPLVADLFLFCSERDFMMSLSDDKQADVIDAFNTTSRYLDDILNINNVYFDNMVSQIYPSELQLNKANASDTEAAF